MVIRRLSRTLRRGLSAIEYRARNAGSPRQVALVRELRKRFRSLTDRSASTDSDAERTWIGILNRLHYVVDTQNPMKFLQWELLRTMNVGDAAYVYEELRQLQEDRRWNDRWKDAITESPVLHPVPFTACPTSSGNLIHHAFHVCEFERKTGIGVNEFDLVFEFGGGYGSMCRLLHSLGFKGSYVIQDFVEFSLLQAFYLKSIGLEVCDNDTHAPVRHGIYTTSDLSQAREISAPSGISNARKLFIATWSLSEAKAAVRQEVMDVSHSFDAFMIAYQASFGEVDNSRYFNEFMERNADVIWEHDPIPQIPGSYYLFGTKRSSVPPKTSLRGNQMYS